MSQKLTDLILFYLSDCCAKMQQEVQGWFSTFTKECIIYWQSLVMIPYGHAYNWTSPKIQRWGFTLKFLVRYWDESFKFVKVVIKYQTRVQGECWNIKLWTANWYVLVFQNLFNAQTILRKPCYPKISYHNMYQVRCD